jgi:hypothetical protein
VSLNYAELCKFSLDFSMLRLSILISGVLLLITSCGQDLVKTSATSNCNDSIDQRDYATAVKVCTLRKDKAAAYLGLAGFDINNLLDSSSKSASAYTAPAGVSLGTDSIAAATVMNLLALDVTTVPNESTRRTRVQTAKDNLDSTTALLHGSLANLSKDELLLDAFALAFASQLDQALKFDNKTTSKDQFPYCDATCLGQLALGNTGTFSCRPVDNEANASSVLVAVDGHIWTAEQTGISCQTILSNLNAATAVEQQGLICDPSPTCTGTPTNPNSLPYWAANGGLLPSLIRDGVCSPYTSLTDYLDRLGDTVALLDLGSGDNTAAITESQTALNTLLQEIGCIQ